MISIQSIQRKTSNAGKSKLVINYIMPDVFIHLFTLSFLYLFVHPFIQWHLLIFSFHSVFIYLTFIHSFILSFIPSFISLFVCWFVSCSHFFCLTNLFVCNCLLLINSLSNQMARLQVVGVILPADYSSYYFNDNKTNTMCMIVVHVKVPLSFVLHLS